MSAAEPLLPLEALSILRTVKRGWLVGDTRYAVHRCQDGRVVATMHEPDGSPAGVEALRRAVTRVPALLAAAGDDVRRAAGCGRAPGDRAENDWKVGEVRRTCTGDVGVTFPPIAPDLPQDRDGIRRILESVPALVEAMTAGETTAWALDGGAWWRRECGMMLRVYTPRVPLGDGDAQWLCEVHPARLSDDAPKLLSRGELPAAEARAWCDRWAAHMLRAIVPAGAR